MPNGVCVAVCVAVSQEVERRNTPCQIGCVLHCALQSVNIKRGGILFAISCTQHTALRTLFAMCPFFSCVSLIDLFLPTSSMISLFKASRWRGGMCFGAWLTCVAVCCKMLQRVASYCSVLQRMAVCWGVLQCVTAGAAAAGREGSMCFDVTHSNVTWLLHM